MLFLVVTISPVFSPTLLYSRISCYHTATQLRTHMHFTRTPQQRKSNRKPQISTRQNAPPPSFHKTAILQSSAGPGKFHHQRGKKRETKCVCSYLNVRRGTAQRRDHDQLILETISLEERFQRDEPCWNWHRRRSGLIRYKPIMCVECGWIRRGRIRTGQH